MTIDQALAIARSMKYKPNWYIRAHARRDSHPHDPMGMRALVVRMTLRVPDVRDPAAMVEISASHELRDLESFDETAFKLWLHHCVQSMEMHEMDEWLMFGKVRLHDPIHPAG